MVCHNHWIAARSPSLAHEVGGWDSPHLPGEDGSGKQRKRGRGWGTDPWDLINLCSMSGGGSVLETHRMSPRAASCFSATWRSRRGSPSSSSRSFSPYRLPSPRVRFVLSQTHREKQVYTNVQHWTGSEVRAHTHQGKEKGRGGREGAGGARRVPVVVDLLLDLGHGRLLSLAESCAHILTASQAQVCGGAEGRQHGEGRWGAGGCISSGPPSPLWSQRASWYSVLLLTKAREAWTYQVSQLRTGILMSKPQGLKYFRGVLHSLSGEALKLVSGCVQTLCSDI